MVSLSSVLTVKQDGATISLPICDLDLKCVVTFELFKIASKIVYTWALFIYELFV